MLHKGQQLNIKNVVLREEQREPLCSNRGQSRCSSLRYEAIRGEGKESNIDRAFNVLFESLLEEKL